MGTWGHGNFENDTAAEHLIMLCKPLIEQLRNAVAHPKMMRPDEYDGEVFMANIEILAVLGENIGRTQKGFPGDLVFPFPFPAGTEIQKWKRKYLKIWDGYIEKLRPSADYRRKRRRLIIQTFDRL